MSIRKPDPADLRTAARTTAQTVWSALFAVGVVEASALPSEFLPFIVLPMVAVLSWVSNEWEDRLGWRRKVAKLISWWSREVG